MREPKANHQFGGARTRAEACFDSCAVSADICRNRAVLKL